MESKMIWSIPLALALFLGIIALDPGRSSNMALAQGPKPTLPNPKAPKASVGTALTYQGQLKKNGSLVNDTCYTQFNLFADAAGTTLAAGTTAGSPNPVAVTSGLFTVQIDFGSNAFNGSARWLQPMFMCSGEGSFTPLSLQQLTPAPYAIGLIPGASVIGGTANGLYAESTLSNGNGVVGRADNGTNAFGVWGESTGGYGVIGESNTGFGVKGIHANSGNYGQLGAWYAGVHGESAGGDGVSGHATTSDKSGVYGVNDGGGYGVYGACSGSGCYGVYSYGNARVTGNLQVDGQANGFFPRPAYDSGWVNLPVNNNQCTTRNHNLGGNTDNYVVDITSGSGGMNNYWIGGLYDNWDNSQGWIGFYYKNLTSASVTICTGINSDTLRLRIWVYK